MIKVYVAIVLGIVVGRLLRKRPMLFLSRVVMAIIWALLFILGIEIGANPEIVGGFGKIGTSAFVIFAFSTLGSILASWLLWRVIRKSEQRQ